MTPHTPRSPLMPSKPLAAALLGWLALAPALALASDHADWQKAMQPITPRSYLCRHVSTPIAVDGNLNDPAWASVPWTEDFVDIQGSAKPAPRFRTRAKLLWDDDYLYIAAELQEPHVWGTLTNHDCVIFMDPDFEVFMDPNGTTEPYYEFEMNALNTGWDLLLDKPYMDQGKPHDAWNIPGLKTAVRVLGTLNNPADTDQGWTVEIAFPWKVLSEHARHPGAPNEGEQWRVDFSRVEWQITTNGGAYQKVPHTPEDNWVWSPTGVIDMHRPEMWGVVQFTRQAADQAVAVAPLPAKPARDLALEVYYAERDFHAAHARWTTNLAELEVGTSALPAGVQAPVLEATPDGYVCAVGFKEGEGTRTWRIRQDRLLSLDAPLAVETEQFIAQAAEQYGDAGRRAAYFLVDNMPANDRAGLSCDFLMENLRLALEARKRFPWARAVPERVFLNDVLPYASLDEPRDPWRAEFYAMATDIVRDCRSATEAAQALNRELFNRLKVHYNTGRKRNNQSPKESIEQGKATCTGLSIILVDACRAVGVPARIVGVPEWVNKEGNHTWVEIWDGDWCFTGADEYDKTGLNRGWFNGDAALTARSTNPLNQIYASSWRRTGLYFPLSWDLESREVPGVNVSARYAALGTEPAAAGQTVHVRLRAKAGGERLRAEVELRNAAGEVLGRDHTRAGRSDMNDMPPFKLPKDATQLTFRFVLDKAASKVGPAVPARRAKPDGALSERALPQEQEVREQTLAVASLKSKTLEFVWSDLTPVSASVLTAEHWLAQAPDKRGPLPQLTFSHEDEARLVALAFEDVRKARAASAAEELKAKQLSVGGKTLKWVERTFGDAPDGKHSLWITLHGGGQATSAENDANWRGYLGRYEFPPGSINIAPRSPANTWDMWFIPEVDGLFDRLIADLVLERGVDPNQVYLIGYSAGGDGVYQLAPRMADRFAAATMCAGHPNDASPDGLRNLPFFLYMGGEDSAYHRNTVVCEYSARIDALQARDPEGYVHRLTVYPGLSHNMQGREAEVIPRMACLRRADWPKRVVWKTDTNPAHARFYWLERGAEVDPAGTVYATHVDGQTIAVEAPASGHLTLRLADALVDLDKPVCVTANGKTVFEGKVARSFGAVVQSLREREDPSTAAVATLPVAW